MHVVLNGSMLVKLMAFDHCPDGQSDIDHVDGPHDHLVRRIAHAVHILNVLNVFDTIALRDGYATYSYIKPTDPRFLYYIRITTSLSYH